MIHVTPTADVERGERNLSLLNILKLAAALRGRRELLPSPYVSVVFTLPAQLAAPQSSIPLHSDHQGRASEKALAVIQPEYRTES